MGVYIYNPIDGNTKLPSNAEVVFEIIGDFDDRQSGSPQK